jgi:hypothetical protein
LPITICGQESVAAGYKADFLLRPYSWVVLRTFSLSSLLSLLPLSTHAATLQAPSVSVAVTPSSIVSEGSLLAFIFMLSANAVATLDVSFTFGTASVNGFPAATCGSGSDYSALASSAFSPSNAGSSVTCSGTSSGIGVARFLAGNSQVTLTVPFNTGDALEGLEQLTATINPGNGYTPVSLPSATGYVSDLPVGGDR